VPSNSSISYQNKNREYNLFKGYYYQILGSLGQQAGFNRGKFKIELKIFPLDSTTIS
jgi:hypothetical protein